MPTDSTTTPAAGSSSSAPRADLGAASAAAAVSGKAAPGASHDLQDDDDDDDDGNDDDSNEEEASAAPGASGDGSAQTEALAGGDAAAAGTKQKNKKKRSKAAAKLRKKLGMGGQQESGALASSSSSSTSPAATRAASNAASAAAATSGSSSASAHVLSDDDVTQLQQAIEKEQGPRAASRADRATLEKLMKMMNLERTALLKDQEARQKQHKALAEHKFWKTQPVTKPDDVALASAEEEGPIESSVPGEQVRAEPYPLPKDFEWVMIDIDNEEQLKEVYDLLSANYVEDVDASLRFNYSPEFLHWVLKHPGYHKTWHIGVRVTSTRKLVAFISGIPHELRVRNQSYPSTEINFLCVHKKLRSKRLAPVLIKEVTRQCHLTGIFQAIYTGGIVIPTPISCARYYHRTLNPQKLLDIGFSAMPVGMSKEQFYARFALPTETKMPGLREMTDDDVSGVGKLLRRYMRRFDMAARFKDDEVRHLFLSGRGSEGKKQVTWTYVIEDPQTSKITDMFSFYSLPSSVLDSDKFSTLEAGYLFYYATDAAFDDASSTSSAATAAAGSSTTMKTQHTSLSPAEQQDEQGVTNWAEETPDTKSKLKTRLNHLMQDMLILAKRQNFDVLNCLTVMDNPLFLNEQKFGVGDGMLRFYLFNWRVVPVAGGMGSRAGEADMDPVVQYAKQRVEAESKGALSEAERARRLASAYPQPEMGSGNGIVMV